MRARGAASSVEEAAAGGGSGCDAAHPGGRQRDWQVVRGSCQRDVFLTPVRLREGRLCLSGARFCA